jgi:hypothetical protein
VQTRRVIMMLVIVPTALLAGAGTAYAGPDSDGQGNRDWGTVASNQAQLDTDFAEGSGGGMGRHSRSTTAADINGGFASSDNAFGITFNEENEDGNHGRLGVGNATRSDPHNEESPSDGGNGRHATNNADLAAVINPVDGQFTETSGLGDSPDVEEELEEGASTDGDDE